jgi:hypothetical protein
VASVATSVSTRKTRPQSALLGFSQSGARRLAGTFGAVRVSGERRSSGPRPVVVVALTMAVVLTGCAADSCKGCGGAHVPATIDHRPPPYGVGTIAGEQYQYVLADSCGAATTIDGRLFVAAHTHAPWEVPSVPIAQNVHGTLVLEDRDHARFVADQRWTYDFVAQQSGHVYPSGCQ